MIATTIEQSKQLLEAGIDLQTADMSYQNYTWKHDDKGNLIPNSIKPIGGLVVGNIYQDFPAWSLSALILLFPERIFYRIARVRGKDVEGIFEDCVTYLCKKDE